MKIGDPQRRFNIDFLSEMKNFEEKKNKKELLNMLHLPEKFACNVCRISFKHFFVLLSANMSSRGIIIKAD